MLEWIGEVRLPPKRVVIERACVLQFVHPAPLPGRLRRILCRHAGCLSFSTSRRSGHLDPLPGQVAHRAHRASQGVIISAGDHVQWIGHGDLSAGAVVSEAGRDIVLVFVVRVVFHNVHCAGCRAAQIVVGGCRSHGRACRSWSTDDRGHHRYIP